MCYGTHIWCPSESRLQSSRDCSGWLPSWFVWPRSSGHNLHTHSCWLSIPLLSPLHSLSLCVAILAFVILKDGVKDCEEAVFEDLKELVKKAVGSFAKPHRFLVSWVAIPTILSGCLLTTLIETSSNICCCNWASTKKYIYIYLQST